MASAWGAAWGHSWGNSWGAVGEEAGIRVSVLGRPVIVFGDEEKERPRRELRLTEEDVSGWKPVALPAEVIPPAGSGAGEKRESPSTLHTLATPFATAPPAKMLAPGHIDVVTPEEVSAVVAVKAFEKRSARLRLLLLAS